MKSTEFITEDIGISVEDAAQMVWRDCQPFIQSIRLVGNKYSLYRGIKNIASPPPTITKLQVQQGRRPKDTPLSIHRAVDNWFATNFGQRFRSNAMFCSNDKYQASGYGPVYSIFPIGNFDYCYSRTVHDLFLRLRRDIHPDIWSTVKNRAEGAKIPGLVKEVDRILSKSGYKANASINDFQDAIRCENEIMIHCSEYYAVPNKFVFSMNSALREIAKK